MIRMNDTIVTISLFTFHMLRIRYIYRHRIMKKGDGMRTMVQGSFCFGPGNSWFLFRPRIQRENSSDIPSVLLIRYRTDFNMLR